MIKSIIKLIVALSLVATPSLVSFAENANINQLNPWVSTTTPTTSIVPRGASTTVRIPSLGSTGNPCVKVSSIGLLGTTTCGASATSTGPANAIQTSDGSGGFFGSSSATLDPSGNQFLGGNLLAGQRAFIGSGNNTIGPNTLDVGAYSTDNGSLMLGTDFAGVYTGASDGASFQNYVSIGVPAVAGGPSTNSLDVGAYDFGGGTYVRNAGAAVGKAYAGIFTAPDDSLIVQGQVGIGTHTPTAGRSLSVVGNSDFTGNLYFPASGGDSYYIGEQVANPGVAVTANSPGNNVSSHIDVSPSYFSITTREGSNGGVYAYLYGLNNGEVGILGGSGTSAGVVVSPDGTVNIKNPINGITLDPNNNNISYTGYQSFGESSHTDYNWANEFAQQNGTGISGFIAKFIGDNTAQGAFGVTSSDNSHGLFLGFGAFNGAGVGVNDLLIQNNSTAAGTYLNLLDGFGNLSTNFGLKTGTIYNTGPYKDSTGSNGTNGYVLKSSGTNTVWVSTSTLGFLPASGGTTNYMTYWSSPTTLAATSTPVVTAIVASSTTATSTFQGSVGFGTSTPTARANFAASSATKSSIRVETGIAPTTPNNGDVWNDSTQNQLAYSNGNTLYQGGNVYTATADQTINTTSPTSAFSGTKVGTNVIAANSLKVGQKISTWGAGYYSTPLANTSTVTITTSIASSTTNTISTVTTAAFPASATNLPFNFLLNCTVRAVGVNGSLVCDGRFEYYTALSGIAPTSNSLSTVGVIRFDSTVAETFDVKANWSAVTTQTATVQESKIDLP